MNSALSSESVDRDTPTGGGLSLPPTLLNVTAAVPTTITDMLKQFESLGDNCEFGIVQRLTGAEPLGLLRFNFTQITALLAGLQTQFSDLQRPNQVQVVWQHNEWYVTEKSYNFSYHTFSHDSTLDPDRLALSHSRWLRYMAEKFLERLVLADRIFVRKGEGPSASEDIRLLHSALRRFGDNTLLWVCIADDVHKAGTVEWIDTGLMRGWIDRFAPYDRAGDVHLEGWVNLCRRAWALWKMGDADAYPVSIPDEIALGFGGWSGSECAVSELAWEVPPCTPGGHVMRHRLISDATSGRDIFGCLISSGLKPGQLYVASASIWLPADFSGGDVALVILGKPSLRISKAINAIRGAWQKIWVSAFLEADQCGAFPRLLVDGPIGTTFYSADWHFERGVAPGITS